MFGYPYFTESGFYDPLLNYEAPQAVGLGTQGTRIYVTLSNVPDGIVITPPQTVDLFGGQIAPAALGGADTASGILTLVKTDAVGAGYFVSLPNTPLVPHRLARSR